MVRFSKKSIGLIVGAAWIIFSVAYIGWNTLRDFHLSKLKAAFEEGRRLTVEQLIKQTQTSDCKPFYVYTETQQVQLLDATCIGSVEKTK